MVGQSSNLGSAETYDSLDDTLDAVFEALRHRRRRIALSSIAGETEPTPVSVLAREVAIQEADRPDTAVPQREFNDVTVSLHHRHLPKLAETDAVEYDRDADMVRATEGESLTDRALSLAVDDQDVR